MSKRPSKLQFNGGVLSPWLEGRTDIAKYDKTAKVCRNFIPLTEGSLKRRGGTRCVAQTPQESEFLFKIIPLPAEAKVMINNVEQRELSIFCGDTVNYEVSADGYLTVSGKITITKATNLTVVLTSLKEQCRLYITANVDDAVIKINGYERSVYTGFKNETVNYTVYKQGYVFKSGTVFLDEDKSITVNLIAEENDDEDITYGDWGALEAFVSCTAYGTYNPQKKCFMLKFANGYLPVLFDAQKRAPDDSDIDENLFFYDKNNGYDALVCAKKVNYLAVIKRGSEAIFYNHLDGTKIAGFDYFSMMIMGWQIDEYKQYASIYIDYDGAVSGKTLKVYYKGELVWTMRGR